MANIRELIVTMKQLVKTMEASSITCPKLDLQITRMNVMSKL